MMNLAEYRPRAAFLPDFLPWAALIAPGIILNKDGAFQRTARFRGPDLDSSVPAELAAISHRLSNAFRRLGERWTLFIEAQRLEVLPSLPYDHLYGLRKLTPTGANLSEDDQAALAALRTEQADIEEAFADYEELPDSADERLGEIETAIESLEGSEDAPFDPKEIAYAGVVVSIDRDGQAQILRGYVRPEDEPSEESPVEAELEGGEAGPMERETVVIPLGGAVPAVVASAEEEADVLRPLPEKLILELTAFRTVALRDAVARHPRVAMTALLHKLVGDTFGHRYGGSCLQAFVSYPPLVGKAQKDLEETVPASSMAHRKELWGDIIPADDQALWEWLDHETDEVRSELLAFCVSFGMNALLERPDTYGSGPSQHTIDCRLKQAMRIAQATDLDLVALGWRPTADTYLNRVPRIRIQEAVREGCGERAAQMIDHLKKGDMVVEAERLLADAGWLPEVLRGPQSDVAMGAPDLESLPAFFAEGDSGTGVESAVTPVAAE